MGGDPPAPAVSESTAEMLKAYNESYPETLRITNAGLVPSAQAQLAANQAVAPGMAALQAQLYNSFGPQMAATANRIQAEADAARAASDLNIIKGSGRDLATEAITTQRLADPEFYKLRESVGGGFDKLFNSIDPSGGLSGGELEAINRGLAQQNNARGTLSNPSQTEIVSNAMQFGEKAYERKQDNQNQLAQALNIANGALPALKSGVDVFQIQTGRPSVNNAADNKFTGVNPNLGSSANDLGGNLLGQIGDTTRQKNEINANRRDSLDRFNESWSSVVGSL